MLMISGYHAIQETDTHTRVSSLAVLAFGMGLMKGRQEMRRFRQHLATIFYLAPFGLKHEQVYGHRNLFIVRNERANERTNEQIWEVGRGAQLIGWSVFWLWNDEISLEMVLSKGRTNLTADVYQKA